MPIVNVHITAGEFRGRDLEFFSTKKGERVVATMVGHNTSIHVHRVQGRWNATIQQRRKDEDKRLGSVRMAATFMKTAEAAFKLAAAEVWPEAV